MTRQRQLECRIVLTHREDKTFDMGMYDPVSMRYEPLGRHQSKDADRIVRNLRERMEREGHSVSYSEVNHPR